MRPGLLVAVLALLALQPVAGDPPAAPPVAAPASPKPVTTEQAADAVLAAVGARDRATLRSLAAKDAPDPWFVADELVRRGEHDAAEAFARAAPRKDVDALPAYLASRRGAPDDAARRARFDATIAALTAGKAQEAWEALGPPEDPPPHDVVGIRLALARGTVLRSLHRLEESAKAFADAAETAEAVGWLSRAATALAEGGRSAYLRSDYSQALRSWERCLRLQEARGSRGAMATTLGNIGLVHDSLGNYSKALEHHERALRMKEELGDRDGAAATLGNIGNVHYALGDYPRALEVYERALEAKEELGNRASVARTLTNIGLVHASLGNYPKALEHHERALTMTEELGDRASVTRNIGSVHHALGDYPKALEHYERAAKTLEELGDRAGVALTLGEIGLVHASLGNHPRALEIHDRALKAMEALHDRAGVAATLGNIGVLHQMLGNYPLALLHCNRALEMKEHMGDRAAVARSLGNVGVLHHLLGDDSKALEHLERALRMQEDLGDRAGVARTLGNVGIVARATADLPRAAKSLDRAVREAERIRADPLLAWSLLELARTRLAAGEPLRALPNAKQGVSLLERMLRGLAEEQGAEARGQYTDLFGVGALAAARTDDPAAVAFFLESGRAGSLMESLGGRQALRWQSLPEDLRRAEGEARAAESVALALYTRALDGEGLAETRRKLAELDAARAKTSDVIERIQREAKKAASLFYPRAATIEEIQGWLGAEEALVLYGFCLDEVLALVLTRGDARFVSLGKEEYVRAACEALALQEDRADPGAALERLRQRVVAPLALGGDVKRVLVSPEGPLSYVPMAALLPDREVAYEPSGTTYGLLLEDRAKRGEAVLALGDPDYGAKFDARAVEVYAGERGPRLAPLPRTREEAKAVGDVALFGKEASEAGLWAALGGKRGRWRAVHFACHGLVDPERPTLSSLALTPDAENDGFLTALEVLRRQIPADLVVLSACETGRGKAFRGEGIVGLTRAFMFAGAPRVLCSLWKVDDEATQALMTRFYERWKAGTPTARALKDAQEHLRSFERWKHPYYWAAWVLWGLPH